MSNSPSFGLNAPQREAVKYLDGPCLVLAGAGSGKTRVITQKIAHLIEDCGYDARNIAALTFTNKAATEMQERIAKLLKEPKQAKQLTVSTFHSLGVKILRQEARALGLKDRFSIMDSDDCFSIVQDLAITTDKQLIRRIQGAMSLWKNGLIAAGVYPNPVPHADFVTSTTHKSMRGPRGGFILMKAEHEKAINSAIFPGIQGGPLMHVIAGKAVAFKEALSPEFKEYQQQVVKNADALAKALIARGLRIISGRTESHVMLVDLRAKNITGKAAEAILGSAHMTCNKNAIPNDPEKPFVTSGIRLGSPAMTTRGFKEAEATKVGNLIADVLDNPHDAATIERVKAEVKKMTDAFPVYA